MFDNRISAGYPKNKNRWNIIEKYFKKNKKDEIMNTYLNKPERIRLSWMNIFWFVVGLLLITGETWGQSYQVTMNQRRLGNKIGVEFWVKDISAGGNAAALGQATFAVNYNTDFLVPDGANAYAITDSIDYDMDIAEPYLEIISPFSLASNGYSSLTGGPADQSNGGTRVYVHMLNINKSLSGLGYKPSTIGRGTFVGMLKFTIKDHANLTDLTKSLIQFNTATFVGDQVVYNYNGEDVEGEVAFVNEGDFNIRGIRILNPNGNQAVNRYPEPALASLSPNKGYPIYFERSGLGGVIGGTAGYGTPKYAYTVDYSLDGGSNWSESGRVAETDLNATTMGANKDLYRSGEIDSLNATNNYFIAQGDGTALPALSGDGYEGVIRLIWKANENFFSRSEQAKLRIAQVDTATSSSVVTARTPYTVNGRKDISDATFVLGRLFFVQLDGTCSYLKTQNNVSTPTQLTVEAWVNLNAINATENAEPGIVVSSAGTASPEEGAWMLYLKDGKYPAFRARELMERGPNGYLGEVVSPDALTVTSSVSPITNAHASNWTHIAASVKDGAVTLYVNGEIVDQYINTYSVNPRLWNTNHPVWIGINPNISIDAGDYLNAGIKEVKVWRTALDQNILRSRMSGVYDANGDVVALGSSATSVDERTTLELYYTLQGARLDIADEYYYQNSANPINWYTCAGTTADNSAINYRPDRSHIKLTAPIGGEGISNLQNNEFNVRWVAYGLGKTQPNTSDIQIMISRDGGLTWFDAIDNQTPAYPLDRVEIEDYQAKWSPYNNITTTGQDDDLQGVLDIEGNYSKNCILKISGTEARNQNDVYDISGEFTVAPFFSMKNNGTAKLQVKTGTESLNLNNATNYFEAWIKPYRFPTAEEGFFPIISKKLDDGSNNMHYALRLLPTGQLEFALTSTTGEATRTARSAAALPIIAPNVQVADSSWTHVGVWVNLANGGTNSSVRFFIDGNPQYVDSISTQLGESIKVVSDNTYPVFFGYEPTTTAGQGNYFVGEMREVRFWGGNPGNQAPSSVEPSALTKFIQGAATIRANELASFGGVDYAANLVAAFSFNGGNFVPTGYVKTANGYPTSSEWLVHMSGNGYAYAATRPTVKLVEPRLEQKVPNTQTDLRVRWIGFDYNRNNTTTFSSGNNGTDHADLEYSIKGGGGITIQDWQYVASQTWSAGYTNSMTLPTTNNSYEFLGTNSKSQYSSQLDVSKADPDLNNNFLYNDQGALGAAKTNGKLRLKGRSTINGTILEYDNAAYGLVPSLRTESELFNITPPSNFTVRVMLEGHHNNLAMSNDVGTSYAEGGFKITLFKNNSGQPGARVDSSESDFGYASSNTAFDPTVAPIRGTDGSEYANVPFVFTDIEDGRYFVKVDQINHLPILSAYAAPFAFAGDANTTWAIESGWDFQGWDGTVNNIITEAEASTSTIGTKYTAHGYAQTDPNQSDYAATGLVYNSGQLGVTTGSNLLAAMVGGDVLKNGIIDAADRAKVVLYDGGSNVSADVTGDGMVNATDRTIVYRNSGKTSSIIDLPATNKAPFDIEENSIFIDAPELSRRFIVTENEAIKNRGTVVKSGTLKMKDPTLQAGLNYRVNAAPQLDNGYLLVPMYITNVGGEFAIGNATFGLQFDPAQLSFVEMTRDNDVIFNTRNDLGYFETFSAPFAKTKDPITNLRTIDVDYDIYSDDQKPGMNVPYSATYLGTLKFKVNNLNEGIFLNWHPITVVHTTKGLNVTGQGTFEPIPAIVVAKVAQLTSPDGGETWDAGKLYQITWTAPTQKGLFYLDYSIDNANTWHRITNNPVNSADLRYNWVTLRVKTTQALVRIVNAENGIEIDRSNAPFSIIPATAEITRPSSADPVYIGGANDFIKWSFDNSATVRFEFSENGNTWTAVTGNVNANDAQVAWNLPAVNTKNAVVRMVNVTTNEVLAQSSTFKILAGTVDLTYPNSKTVVNIGQKHDIAWKYENVNRFDLQLSIDNGATWSFIATDVTAMNKKFNWLVPNVNSKNAIIRAIYNGDESMEYSRTEAFKIEGTVGVDDDNQIFVVSTPAPNPFFTGTKVDFTLPYDLNVNVVLFNSIGERVATIISGQEFSAGDHSINIAGDNIPSGTYYIVINAGPFNMTKEVIKLK